MLPQFRESLLWLYVPTNTRIRKAEPEKWLTPQINATVRHRNETRKNLIIAKKKGFDCSL